MSAGVSSRGVGEERSSILGLKGRCWDYLDLDITNLENNY